MTYTPEQRNLKNHIALGNKKLPATTAIFNIGSATNCPSRALGYCLVSNECYAMKAERQYPDVFPYRERQRVIFNDITPSAFVATINIMNMNKRTNFIDTIRFNESGDFKTQADVTKVEEIARLLSYQRIKVYAYSSNKALDFTNCEHATINVSRPDMKGHNYVRATKTLTKGNPDIITCPGSCFNCNACAIKTGKIIEIAIH